MKYGTLFALAIFTACFSAKLVSAEEIAMNMAQMQAMDKITGRVSIIEVPVGGEVKFGTFSIVVRACQTKSEEEIPENTAFVDVSDKSFDKEEFNIFKGWMFSSSPAVNAVEHPIYDVWLIKCFNGDAPKEQLLSADELKKRDELPRLSEVRAAQKQLNENSFEIIESNIQFKDSMYKEEPPQTPSTPSLIQKEEGEPENLLNIRESYEEPEEETVVLPAEELTKAMNDEISNLKKISDEPNGEENFQREPDEQNVGLPESKILVPENGSPLSKTQINETKENIHALENMTNEQIPQSSTNVDQDLKAAIEAELAKHGE